MMTKRWILAGVTFLAIAYGLWAVFFIYRSSFIAADGQRWFSLFDDAMISMRYAWNFSHGDGLVWNPGERVEGYTNLLMVLWMSLWTGLLSKSEAVLAVQITGIPVLLGIGVLGMLHWNELATGGEVNPGSGMAALAFMGCLLYYPLAYWTLMGMETGLLTLLLLAGSLFSLIHMRTGNRRPLLAASAAFGLGYLTRPDSAPVAALMLAAASIFGRGGPKGRLTAAVLSLGAYLLFPIVQTVFREAYYGSLVPLTYTLKATGMPLAARLENGVAFTLPFVNQARLAYLIALSGALLPFSKRKAYLLIPPVALLGYQTVIGGDAWPYWRLVAPGIPYLILLGLAAADWMVGAFTQVAVFLRVRPAERGTGEGSSRRRWPPRPSLSLMIALASVILMIGTLFADPIRSVSPGFGYAQRLGIVTAILLAFAAGVVREQPGRSLMAFGVSIFALGSLNQPFLRQAVHWSLPSQVEGNREHVNAAIAVNRFTTPEASVGVIWAGIIPYYTGRYAVDFLGKNDPYIAGLPANLEGPGWAGMDSVPGHNKYDLEYSILGRMPTYVEAFKWGTEDLSAAFDDYYVEVTAPGENPSFRIGDPAVRWDIIPADMLRPSRP